MVRVNFKLKKSKQVLRKWNVEIVGRMERDLRVIEEDLIALEQKAIDNLLQEAEAELLSCKQKRL